MGEVRECGEFDPLRSLCVPDSQHDLRTWISGASPKGGVRWGHMVMLCLDMCIATRPDSPCTSDALAVACERSGVKGKPLVPCAGEYCVLQSWRDLLAMDSQIKQNRRETPKVPDSQMTESGRLLVLSVVFHFLKPVSLSRMRGDKTGLGQPFSYDAHIAGGYWAAPAASP